MQNENNRSFTSKEDEMVQNVSKVLEELPKEKRDIIYSAFYAIEKSYSGPLPPPEDFASYERTLPGSMNKILELTEKQVDHRIDYEKKEIKQDGRGQILGASLVALFGLFSFLLAMYGHDGVALGLGVTTVIALAVVFVLNKVPSNITGKENKK